MRSQRKFSEEEVHALLRYASARQQEQQQHTRLEEGLTLEEIQRIAEDAGIEPGYLREAVLDLQSNEPEGKSNAFLGGPVNFKIERFVEGRLDDEDQALVVSELRKHFPKKNGKYNQLGSMLDWKIGAGTSTINVHLEPVGENTRILWDESMYDTAVLMHILPFVMVFLSIAVSLKNGAPQMAVASLALLSYLASRYFYGRFYEKNKSRAQEAMKNVVAIAEENANLPEPVETLRTPESGRIELEENAATEQQAHTKTGRRSKQKG